MVGSYGVKVDGGILHFRPFIFNGNVDSAYYSRFIASTETGRHTHTEFADDRAFLERLDKISYSERYDRIHAAVCASEVCCAHSGTCGGSSRRGIIITFFT